jgi:hypothetical protein
MPEGSWRTAVALEGALFRATGSAFDAPYDRARFSVSPVGTARIEFGYGGTATLTFTVDGKTVVKTAKRSRSRKRVRLLLGSKRGQISFSQG